MDDPIMKTLMAILMRDGSTMEEAVMKYRSLPDNERTELMSNSIARNCVSSTGMHDMIKKSVIKQEGVPLANIRDKNGKLFNNYICLGCGKGLFPKLLTCSRCKAAKYCSKQCQILDWSGKGQGPTKPQPHKELCPKFLQVNKEFTEHATAGETLRATLFSSWTNQHHDSGAFFLGEFLAQKDVLGGIKVGYWAVPDVISPYHASGKDPHGFFNGKVMVDNEVFPTHAKGWTSAFKPDEYPNGPAAKSLPKDGLKGWEDYLCFRDIAPTSIAPLLLTNVLTIYQMIHHELKLSSRKTLVIHLLGVETELNQIPLFEELLYLLPGIDLEIVMISAAAKDVCDEVKSKPKKNQCIARRKYVLDVTDSVGKGRIRVRLHPDHDMYHDVPESSRPDAVLALNAGLGSYQGWAMSVYKILRLGIPFCVTDQTVVTMRFYEVVWLPSVIGQGNMGYPPCPPLSLPKTETKLNPFHGVVNRDVAAVLVPNLNNGYLMTFR